MKSLLLLHGAIGCAKQLEPLAAGLSAQYDVHTLNFSGHGGRPVVSSPFSMELFAQEVLEYLSEKGIDKAAIFGYSMGGYVGMYLAKQRPDKIDKLVTLATKYHWDEPTAAKEVQMLNPEKIEQKVRAFAESLRVMHAPNDWKLVLQKTADMMLALGRDNALKPGDYPSITTPVLLLIGEKDRMVTAEETLRVHELLPGSVYKMLPDTQHPLDQVDVSMLAELIRSWVG